MELTGYTISKAIRNWTTRRDTTKSMIDNPSWFSSNGDTQGLPHLLERFEKADEAIAKLQVIQAGYNLGVKVTIPGEGELTLSEAVKRVGGIVRSEKMWKDFSTARRGDLDQTSTKLDPNVAIKRATEKTKLISEFRSAIAIGNNVHTCMDVDASLFE